jgi:hypothetical protein
MEHQEEFEDFIKKDFIIPKVTFVSADVELNNDIFNESIELLLNNKKKLEIKEFDKKSNKNTNGLF